ncbi:MAG: hypothetical protein EAY75_05060 [Bacteroidetes bacterium]|nr:MAG: hypothetical protein EAY75_05060 [Bacteroidota bacterium]
MVIFNYNLWLLIGCGRMLFGVLELGKGKGKPARTTGSDGVKVKPARTTGSDGVGVEAPP